jgi:hypothetical protein
MALRFHLMLTSLFFYHLFVGILLMMIVGLDGALDDRRIRLLSTKRGFVEYIGDELGVNNHSLVRKIVEECELVSGEHGTEYNLPTFSSFPDS